MKNISFIRYSPVSSTTLLTAQLVECYRNVFADSPWHEWLRCPKCQKYWGVKDKELLKSVKYQHCDTPLVDFWSKEQVVSDIFHEITAEASCWLAINSNSVIGFCWGYPIAIIDLEKKLDISFDKELMRDADKKVAYQDEVGVLSNYRGNKIAKAMIVRRLDDFLIQGFQIGIVRTRLSPEPSQTFLWYTKVLGYRIIANYPGEDGRVILGRKLAGLKELLIG